MEFGLDAPKYLDGMFSWVLYDKKADRTIAARDPVGITSFYQGWSSTTPGAVYFASELKCLHPVCDKIKWFPPGKVSFHCLREFSCFGNGEMPLLHVNTSGFAAAQL